MKAYELLREDYDLHEAPLGGLQAVGNKIASKLGSQTATGKLQTGAVANQLKKELENYLGRTGLQADQATVLKFLAQKGYPTKKAASVTSTTAPPVPPVQGGDNAAPPAADATPNLDIPTWQRQGLQPPSEDPAPHPQQKASGYNNQAPYNINAPTGAPSRPGLGTPPSNVNPQAKQQGQQIQQRPTPPVDRISLPRGRGRKKKAARQDQVVNASVYEAALPKNIIDRMLLAAAQEAQQSNVSGQPQPPSGQRQGATPPPAANNRQTQSPPAPQQGGSSGGFGAGLRQGLSGFGGPAPSSQTQQKLGVNQLIAAAKQLQPRDRQKLIDVVSRFNQQR
jgi:hypothetical protein